VDGERDLRALARELGRGEFDVAKAVFSLVSEGVVALATRRQEKAAAAVGAGDAHLLAARAAAGRGEWGTTLEHLEEAVAADPLLADAHCELGVAAVRLGRLERAEEALHTCLRLPHGDGGRRARVERLHRAVTELGDALREVGG
jgi:tetratricopeptide (TPR) repeat protein